MATKTKTTPSSAPEITLKNLKTCQGREGIAFSCVLYVDGKKAAFASDDGNGGSMRIDWTPTRKPGRPIWESPVKDRLEAWCATQGERTYADGAGGTFSSKVSIELLINEEIDRMQEEKQLRRWCKTKVVFRLVGAAEGEYLTLPVKFEGNEAKVKATLDQRYGAKLAEILNERFAA
jgi:hypothetical protein